jgi:hypothetical protein
LHKTNTKGSFLETGTQSFVHAQFTSFFFVDTAPHVSFCGWNAPFLKKIFF